MNVVGREVSVMPRRGDADTQYETRPRTICIELSRRCNYSCPHCRSESSPAASAALSLESVLQFVERVAAIGRWRISITGGEPTLWKRLPDLIHRLNQLGLSFAVTTNGSSSAFRLLRLPSELWNNGTLKVSVDGSRPLHDALRGAGSYDKAIEFLGLARQVVKRLCVNTTMIWDVTCFDRELIATLDRLALDKWTLISPVGRERWGGDLADATYRADYAKQVETVRARIAEMSASIPLGFLDYAAKEHTVRDVVFVASTGEVLLPSHFRIGSPTLASTHIESADVALSIQRAVEDFEATGMRLQ